MKQAVILLAVFASALSRPQRSQQNYQQQQQQPPIPILHYQNDQPGDGTYRFSYETGDGIRADEQGEQRAVADETGKVEHGTVSQGSYSYTSPEGQLITVTYVADEHGFRATGAHLPTPPPVPEAIQRSLDLIARLNG